MRDLPSAPEDWLNIVLEPMQDLHLRVVMDFEGTLDAPRFARAVRLSMEAEPVLGCRFVGGVWRARWERRDDLDSIDLCALVASDDVGRDLTAFLATRLKPFRDPLVRARIFRSASGNDTVCVKLCHGAGDGIAFKEYLSLLAGIYRRLETDPAYVPGPDPRACRTQSQVLRRFPVHEKLRSMFFETIRRDSWSFPYENAARTRPTFSERTLEPEAFTEVLAAARRKRVSVNDVIVTAFFRAMFAAAEPRPGIPHTVFIPVDLRRYLPAKRTFALCNLFSYIILDMPRRPGAPFDQTLAEVHGFFEAEKSRSPGLGFAVFMEALGFTGYGAYRLFATARVLGSKLSGNAYPTISNMGVWDPDSMVFPGTSLRAVRLYSPIAYPPTFTIIAGSFRNALTLTCSYCADAVRQGAVEECLDRMVLEIRTAAQ